MTRPESYPPVRIAPMCKEIKATVAAFAVAFLIPSLVWALLIPVTGGAINTDLVSICGLTAIFYVYCMMLAGPLAVPVFLLLRRYRLVRWWSALGSGVVIGAFVETVLGLPGMAPDWRALVLGVCTGALASTTFWLVWRLGQAR